VVVTAAAPRGADATLAFTDASDGSSHGGMLVVGDREAVATSRISPSWKGDVLDSDIGISRSKFFSVCL
jgi:hypothetical protein